MLSVLPADLAHIVLAAKGPGKLACLSFHPLGLQPFLKSSLIKPFFFFLFTTTHFAQTQLRALCVPCRRALLTALVLTRCSSSDVIACHTNGHPGLPPLPPACPSTLPAPSSPRSHSVRAKGTQRWQESQCHHLLNTPVPGLGSEPHHGELLPPGMDPAPSSRPGIPLPAACHLGPTLPLPCRDSQFGRGICAVPPAPQPASQVLERPPLIPQHPTRPAPRSSLLILKVLRTLGGAPFTARNWRVRAITPTEQRLSTQRPTPQGGRDRVSQPEATADPLQVRSAETKGLDRLRTQRVPFFWGRGEKALGERGCYLLPHTPALLSGEAARHHGWSRGLAE